jgi:hypothetical protein
MFILISFLVLTQNTPQTHQNTPLDVSLSLYPNNAAARREASARDAAAATVEARKGLCRSTQIVTFLSSSFVFYFVLFFVLLCFVAFRLINSLFAILSFSAQQPSSTSSTTTTTTTTTTDVSKRQLDEVNHRRKWFLRVLRFFFKKKTTNANTNETQQNEMNLVSIACGAVVAEFCVSQHQRRKHRLYGLARFVSKLKSSFLV